MPWTRGFDTTSNVSQIARDAYVAGYSFVGRYLADNWKGLTRAEAAAIGAAGMDIVSFYETDPTSIGYFDPKRAPEELERCHDLSVARGQPRGSCWYHTVDFDAAGRDTPKICDFFAALRETLKALTPGEPPSYLLGAYGDGAVLAALIAKGLIDRCCLAGASAWDGSADFARASLVQSPPSRLLGLSVDLLHSPQGNAGGWRAT